MAQVLVPCWNQMHVHIFESSQLEGPYVGDLLYNVQDFYLYLAGGIGRNTFTSWKQKSTSCMLRSQGELHLKVKLSWLDPWLFALFTSMNLMLGVASHPVTMRVKAR